MFIRENGSKTCIHRAIFQSHVAPSTITFFSHLVLVESMATEAKAETRNGSLSSSPDPASKSVPVTDASTKSAPATDAAPSVETGFPTESEEIGTEGIDPVKAERHGSRAYHTFMRNRALSFFFLFWIMILMLMILMWACVKRKAVRLC